MLNTKSIIVSLNKVKTNKNISIIFTYFNKRIMYTILYNNEFYFGTNNFVEFLKEIKRQKYV